MQTIDPHTVALASTFHAFANAVSIALVVALAVGLAVTVFSALRR